MQVWKLLHAARCKYRTQKVAKNRHLGTIAQLRRAISSKLRHISIIEKNLLSSNMSSTCPHDMVNFGPLAAVIVSLVWGTPANFNGFGVLFHPVSSSFFFFMAALCNRGAIIFLPCDFYLSIYLSFFFLFFPRLISAVGDWMSTILPHMVWP